MTNQTQTVFIVDDDQAVRDSLADLMDSVGINVETYATANDFLGQYTSDRLGCLILDIRMPGMSGLELQQELIRRDTVLPIIFITGHGDVPMAVQAIQAGALDFIQKPFRDQDLLDRVNYALKSCDSQQNNQQQTQSVKKHIHNLTPREHQVMEMIVEGKANKVIAIDLGLSQRTIEVHRKNVMQKLEARSLAELVRIVTQTGLA
ncbi:response regulator transcription factor [Cocleimonas flava]|uniref:LuxR family two component transcriptional regulator n=1 Tax=Cocleimonas flava TaxID=634765 RepID=A0A4R1F4S9_9GAMM|nr:response regulator [Cocleimonas flava]TCJ87594.1 LuxR family two component transcriptional regulator [Cocleimonas flava]